ncbi:OLC1v1036093C2 [Oldenlandia corymbosa var. corymbosa]|uniref:OLC1v1036093C2 n=1 Tax=Oldenlandia corymbosa var. corymbosa TaxID=529605 RepID=A0AAV1CXP4_OLDCO|nr:OLC1v1036093C2 [Oldenlandia corymbosa var. corymbosa]
METKRRHNNTGKPEERHSFIQRAGLILPYLLPSDLASISSACKTLRDISQSITSRRSSDAARSLDNSPVPFVNEIDHQPYSYFIYTPVQTISSSSSSSNSDLQVQPWGYDPDTRPDLTNLSFPDPFLFRVQGAAGCACGGICERVSGCPCFGDQETVDRECGPSCECGPGCGNRITQRGVMVKLKIVRERRKGWCLCAAEFIPKGQFVCELLSTKEAQSRQQMYDDLAINGQLSPALLVVKEHLPSRDVCMRTNIDATRVGNVARFMNHSCDGGNMNTTIVHSSGSLVPRICLFASRDIHNHEELTFSYGDNRLRKQGLPCFCGSSCCQGFLPSERT